MNVARAIFHGVVEHVVDQLDDRALTGGFGCGGNIFHRLLDQLDCIIASVINDVVDDKDPLVGQIRLHHAADVFTCCDHNLDVAFCDVAELFDQKDICWFRNRDSQRVSHFEERQHRVLVDEVARQRVHDLRVEQAAFELHIRQAQLDRQPFENLFFATPTPIHQQLAEQLRSASRSLFLQRHLQLLFGQKTSCDQQVAQPTFGFEQ